MKTNKRFFVAAALALTAAGLPAQTGTVATPFQQAGQFGTAETMPRPAAPVIAAQGRGGRSGSMVPVVGKPLSATEERKTVQTLADGTQIENIDTNLYFRDPQGRTRVEQTVQGRARVTISDPVAHTMLMLDPAAKTVRKVTLVASPMPAGMVGPQSAQPGGRGQAGQLVPATTGGGVVTRGGGGGGGRGGGPGTATPTTAYAATYSEGMAAGRAATPQEAPIAEELGIQTINGVAAQGTRNTQVIPAGRIGNNRDIHVVNERWFSADLQMLVKTVNSDPRFGTTTYQLMNINQNVPDAGLFQAPSDYTLVEAGQ